ncbi:MAG: stage II sporulation protein R [Bacilli bacterium]|nr:stage II sporulation protein R [Bacilli bacterium]
MKKTIILLIFIGLFYGFISNVMAENIEIPDDAIRIRVVPNSNSDYDQEIKGKVRTVLESTMYDLLKDSKNSDEARKIISSNLNTVEKNVEDILQKERYDKDYKVNFGYNYFPEKEYKGVTYEDGYYESLLVTLGEGKGDNWWCVLFPPLCLVEAEESTDVEYKSLIKEVLNKYL